jgi:rhodanese-related sulfurtransferase
MSQVILVLLGLLAAYLVFRMIVRSRASLSPNDAHAAVQSGTAVLVDIREPPEWRGGVAAPAVLLPLSDLLGTRKQWGPFLEQHRGQRILVYCHSGGRSGWVASKLNAEGYDAANIGGYGRWTRHGLPTRRP